MAMTKIETLMQLRKTYSERGCKLIELTHKDGTKSGIANEGAIKAVMDALLAELNRQIVELL